MPRRSTRNTSAAPPPGFVLGKDLDISSWHGGTFALDDADHLHCYVGYRKEQQPHDLPYYSPSVALHDCDGRRSFRFVELSAGALQKSFLSEDHYYRILEDKWLVLPSGASGYFGVISKDDRSEDEDLTRLVFGGTTEDIQSVARALALVLGWQYHEFGQLPRVTFSKTRSNRCDMTGCLIPKDFPYIAFEASQYDWSHVSLYGFYRLLAFLCPSARPNYIAKALLENGVTEALLKRFVNNGDSNISPLPMPEFYS